MYSHIEQDYHADSFERPDPGDGDDTCKHGKVTYGAGDCEECDAEEAAAEEALIASYPEYIEPGPCSVCGGELDVLGTLGLMQHLECRQCGAPHSRQLSEVTA